MPPKIRRLTYKEKRLLRWSLAGASGCTLASLALTYPVMAPYGPDVLSTALKLAVVIPFALALPLFGFLQRKLQQLASLNRRLEMMAKTDALTQCLNRGAFVKTVEAELATPDASGGAFAILDADHFKRINDEFGHRHGDEALIVIAAALRTRIEPPNVFGRIGGEEFAVFLPNCGSRLAQDKVESLREAVENAGFTIDGIAWPLTVSAGLVTFKTARTYDEVFVSADRNLYAAKHDGRNRVVASALTEPQRPTDAAGVLASALRGKLDSEASKEAPAGGGRYNQPRFLKKK